MEHQEQRIFHNGKELLEGCIEQLNQNQSREVGGNVARFPTVIIFLGEQSKPYMEWIKRTLDDNWNNSRFLQYISIVRENHNWSCSVLTGTKQGEVEWKPAEGSPNDRICKAVVEMLQLDERVFREKSSIKMEFVLDSTEEELQTYWQLYLTIQNNLQAENRKTLFFMLDQNPGRKREYSAENFLKDIWSEYRKQTEEINTGNSFGTVYLLGNYLTSGSILGKNKIWQNYRLAADIILLSGSRDSEGRYTSKLYNGIKTAAYALVTKPTDEIAAVSLQTLLREMYEQQRQEAFSELSDQEIQKRLGITDTQFDLAEQIFQEKILPYLPLQEHLLYLPFRSERELQKLQKMEPISAEAADQCTMGAWTLLVQRKYLRLVEEFWEKEEEVSRVRERIQDLLHQAFSIFELESLLPKREYYRQLLQKELCSEGIYGKADFTEKLYKSALYQSKKSFYKKIKQVLSEEWDRILVQAKAYKERYLYCEKEIQDERIVTGDENLSIEKLYANEVRQYVEQYRMIESFRKNLLHAFDIRLKEEEFLDAVWKIFLDLINQEIFHYDFEKELDFRMNNMADNHKQIYVATKLQKTLSGSIRFRSLTDSLRKISCFYLIHGRANYAKQLAKQEGNGRDFMLFYLNRSDCMEQIEIYEITKLD